MADELKEWGEKVYGKYEWGENMKEYRKKKECILSVDISELQDLAQFIRDETKKELLGRNNLSDANSKLCYACREASKQEGIKLGEEKGYVRKLFDMSNQLSLAKLQGIEIGKKEASTQTAKEIFDNLEKARKKSRWQGCMDCCNVTIEEVDYEKLKKKYGVK